MNLEENLKAAQGLAKLLEDKKASKVTVLEVSEKTPIADFFVIATAESFIHSKALEDYCTDYLEKSGFRRLNPVNMFAENPWILLDYGDIIVHIFKGEARAYYEIERLWFDTKKVYQGE